MSAGPRVARLGRRISLLAMGRNCRSRARGWRAGRYERGAWRPENPAMKANPHWETAREPSAREFGALITLCVSKAPTPDRLGPPAFDAGVTGPSAATARGTIEFDDMTMSGGRSGPVPQRQYVFASRQVKKIAATAPAISAIQTRMPPSQLRNSS